MKNKKEKVLGIRMDDEMLAALEKLADADDRSISAMARKLILEGLRERGLIESGSD